MRNNFVSQGRGYVRRILTLDEFGMVVKTQRVDDNKYQGQERKYHGQQPPVDYATFSDDEVEIGRYNIPIRVVMMICMMLLIIAS